MAFTKVNSNDSLSNFSNSNLMISARAGYDFPFYKNNTPNINYKGGVTVGISIDYYWKWIGIGADVDFIKNHPKNIFPTNNLQNNTFIPITNFNTLDQSVTRMFYGIGPNFKYQTKNRKFVTELNTRLGMGLIKGGKTLLQENTTPANQLLNFHGGYNTKTSFSTKGQIRLSYFFIPSFGVNIGAYYIRHFRVPELYDASIGATAIDMPYNTTSTPGFNTYNPAVTNIRNTPCDCDISSFGVFSGLTYRFVKKNGKSKNSFKLAVTAKDKYTNELLPFTKVTLKNRANQIVQTGTTNASGVVIFDNIPAEDYLVTGTLYDVSLENSTISENEFSNNKTLEKEILYSDRNFIIKGKVFECNSTNPISGINVILENTSMAYKKSTITNSLGEYIMQLPANGNYNLYGKKDNYFSQIENISASVYNRDKNLFVKLEMCSEFADCGKSIGLKNILFDLDKFEIIESAKPELDKLVRFMKDNPNVRVELSSHTDCRGSTEYNNSLSQKRADASVDYIVSQGISRSRISGIGYGETKLLNGCVDGVNCSEAQHAINRRTEMKVICK